MFALDGLEGLHTPFPDVSVLLSLIFNEVVLRHSKALQKGLNPGSESLPAVIERGTNY